MLNVYIAAIESMVGGMLSGCIYHLFSGQPLTIIGSTGPILVFETIMYQEKFSQTLIENLYTYFSNYLSPK